MRKVSILIALWVFCGIFNFGATFAFFEGKYPAKAEADKVEYRHIAGRIAALGPLGSIPAILCSNVLEYGWRLH